MSGPTFQCVSDAYVCSCEQTCVHMGSNGVRALKCQPGPRAHITVPGRHQCSNLTHKTGFSSSQTWGRELG